MTNDRRPPVVTLRRGFTAAWLAWLLAFVVVEAVAVVSKAKGDTLSEHVYVWFGVKAAPPSWLRWPLRVGLVWLAVHLGTGWI